MVNALLLSNSTMPGTSFFTWPRPWVKKFLRNTKELIFIPYAAVTFSYDEYEAKVKEVFQALGYSVTSIHRTTNKRQALAQAEGIIVGGGNTFALLSRLYTEDLIASIRNRVFTGIPYIGWSAGANLACPTIMTTNDMPIIQPASFMALNLIPFQINPHYHELKFESQGGETRRERLEEFLVMNSSVSVVGLPEGMLLHRMGDTLHLEGNGIAKLYQAGKPVMELHPGADLSALLYAEKRVAS
jgi:dipeptidase E